MGNRVVLFQLSAWVVLSCLLFACAPSIKQSPPKKGDFIIPLNTNFITTHFTFPNGLSMALVMSYDDGCIEDRRLVDIFNRYGIKGTFHLNSGKLDRVETWDITYRYISSNEVQKLYQGHEVSAHTVNHPDLTKLDKASVSREIDTDQKTLENLVHYPIRGMSMPFGTINDEVLSVMEELGLSYARIGQKSRNFAIPDKPLLWRPTCHHSSAHLFIDKFFQSESLSVFFIMGHSWEFEKNETNNSWEYIEGICERLSIRKDIWNVTLSDLTDYLMAIERIGRDFDGKVVVNHSPMSVWVRTKKGVVEVKTGEKIDID